VDGDTTILDASPSKFIFTVDGEEEAFAKRIQIDPGQVQTIRNLQRAQGRFSECFHVDNLGSKVLRIVLSKQELWSYTSKKEDKEKIVSLMQAVPNLTIEEAIKCLSLF
jgi:hypothetical protein